SKEKPAFGKLNINKPTSERKVSVYGKRTSGPGSRNSQFGIFSCSEKIKDPRPLNDKAFIQQCIRLLCEFLTENGYAYSVSMKSLQAPSVKDFLKIFTFLYGFLCPSYEFPDTKFEEEVPRIFKGLGYPFALSKSSMYTVGAPHTWPHIVAALVWLIDCIKLHTAMKESSPLFDDGQPWGEETEDGIMYNKLFLDYTIKCYESFMTGADSFEEKLESETMKQENTRLQNIVDNQKYSVADIERINHERNELQQTINKLTKDLEDEQQQLWNEELKYARGKEAIETQLAEYHKLARKLKLIPKGAENSKGYDFEIKFNPEAGANCLVKYRAQVYIETQLAEYHKLARKLKLIPKGAENSKGYDFEIKFNPEAGANCLVKYRAQVYEAEEEDKKCANELESLEKHKHMLESAVNEGLSEAMNELDSIQRESMFTCFNLQQKHLEEQIAKVDREYEEHMSEDLLENIREIGDKYKKKAALIKSSDE
ncbi:PREDICTED: kinetochore protein NDC80 homolog, partial [Hipposideros armiger]|uniref:Kinetochore protein NDC80 n=1 Tax=Hipposideros armiger TaxID=186990 RepID=A0A8B7T9I9_HIPAR